MAPKTVLITGSNRNIGLAFAKYYTKHGWNVIAAARNPDAAEDVSSRAFPAKRCAFVLFVPETEGISLRW